MRRGRRLGTAPAAELAIGVAEVKFHCRFAQRQRLRGVLVGRAAGNEQEKFRLLSRQAEPCACWRGREAEVAELA